ncbi:hypothetical protein [Micromonospora sp. NPDC047134]|uniref:hypothetical protein n=1 Tax=Micromonospora sp. NPDC047134 TaxID=3154340 RepID=UPI0033F3B472
MPDHRDAAPASTTPTPPPSSSTSPVTAIPFSTWGNRAPGPMRVWLPRAPR